MESLTGSEKQIRWAKEIRARFLKKIDADLETLRARLAKREIARDRAKLMRLDFLKRNIENISDSETLIHIMGARNAKGKNMKIIEKREANEAGYTARYTDSNDAANEIELTATTEKSAKSEATRKAPALRNITLEKNGVIIATRKYWQNTSGQYGLEKWKKFNG